jgi:hypothetical protein
MHTCAPIQEEHAAAWPIIRQKVTTIHVNIQWWIYIYIYVVVYNPGLNDKTGLLLVYNANVRCGHTWVARCTRPGERRI